MDNMGATQPTSDEDAHHDTVRSFVWNICINRVYANCLHAGLPQSLCFRRARTCAGIVRMIYARQHGGPPT
jgi:hypothetical protein